MDYSFSRPNPFQLSEVVGIVISFLSSPCDLLQCARVSKVWNPLALKELYKGSLGDMRYCTPPINFLNSLFTASRDRFEQCASYIEHLALLLHVASYDINQQQVRFEQCRVLRNKGDAKLPLQSNERSITGLAIPFEFKIQNNPLAFDLLPLRALKCLTIEASYCGDLVSGLCGDGTVTTVCPIEYSMLY